MYPSPMKTSKIISELIELKKKHGDLEVLLGDAHSTDWREYTSRVVGPPEVVGDDVMIWLDYGPRCGECRRGCD